MSKEGCKHCSQRYVSSEGNQCRHEPWDYQTPLQRSIAKWRQSVFDDSAISPGCPGFKRLPRDAAIAESLERLLSSYNSRVEEWLARCGLTKENARDFELVNFTNDAWKLELRRDGKAVSTFRMTWTTVES